MNTNKKTALTAARERLDSVVARKKWRLALAALRAERRKLRKMRSVYRGTESAARVRLEGEFRTSIAAAEASADLARREYHRVVVACHVDEKLARVHARRAMTPAEKGARIERIMSTALMDEGVELATAIRLFAAERSCARAREALELNRKARDEGGAVAYWRERGQTVNPRHPLRREDDPEPQTVRTYTDGWVAWARRQERWLLALTKAKPHYSEPALARARSALAVLRRRLEGARSMGIVTDEPRPLATARVANPLDWMGAEREIVLARNVARAAVAKARYRILRDSIEAPSDQHAELWTLRQRVRTLTCHLQRLHEIIATRTYRPEDYKTFLAERFIKPFIGAPDA